MVPFAENTRLVVRHGMTGATGNIYCGLHEAHEMGFLLHFLRSSDSFLDVGSNIGTYSILSAGVIGANTEAFEPVPETYLALQANVEENGLSNRVKLNKAAVGSEIGQLRFSCDADTMNHAVAEDYLGKAIDVPVMTLDSLSLPTRPTLVKIDVEGFEYNVLAGGLAYLSSELVRAIIMETNGCGSRFGRKDADAVALLERCGFVRIEYDAITRTLREGSLNSTMNSIFVRDTHEAANRTKSAPIRKLSNGMSI